MTLFPGNAGGTTIQQSLPHRQLTGEGLKTTPAFKRQHWGETPNRELPSVPLQLRNFECLWPTTHPIYTHFVIFLSFHLLHVVSQFKLLSNSRSLAMFITAQFPFQEATQSNCRMHLQEPWTQLRQEGRELVLERSVLCCSYGLLRVAGRHNLSSSILNGSQTI